jgi:hypothetical protein
MRQNVIAPPRQERHQAAHTSWKEAHSSGAVMAKLSNSALKAANLIDGVAISLKTCEELEGTSANRMNLKTDIELKLRPAGFIANYSRK